MDIIRHRKVTPDRWRHELNPRETSPTSDIAAGDVIVSLARWRVDHAQLRARRDRVGVRLEAGDTLPSLVAAGLAGVALIEIVFQSFAEGRGYTLARLLRARHGFEAELRASGDVSRERIAFMERCGFDSFVLTGDASPAAALAAFAELSLAYQPGAGGGDFLARRRGWRKLCGAIRSAA